MSFSALSQRGIARTKRSGFSLVETVIALGIVALGLIPMIGLMPIGMNTYRHSVDQMAGTCIAQQITGEYSVLSTSSQSWTQTSTQQRYFDNMGQETGSATSAATIYYVNVVETTGLSLPGDPGAGSGRQLNQVQIEVWYNPSHLPFSLQSNGLLLKSAGQQIREYSTYVAK